MYKNDRYLSPVKSALVLNQICDFPSYSKSLLAPALFTKMHGKHAVGCRRIPISLVTNARSEDRCKSIVTCPETCSDCPPIPGPGCQDSPLPFRPLDTMERNITAISWRMHQRTFVFSEEMILVRSALTVLLFALLMIAPTKKQTCTLKF